MLRRGLLVTPFLLFGCAASRTMPMVASETAISLGTNAPPVEPRIAAADTRVFSDFAPSAQAQPAPHPQPMPRQRFTVKTGYYSSNEDEFDDGTIILGSWLRPMSGRFSSEVEIGYLDASGSEGAVDTDVWGIPFMGGGRFTIPVGEKIELYLGVGLGTIYYEAEAKTLGIKVEADGFLLAGDGYFGGAIHLGQAFVLGLEGKYYVTDSDSDIDGLEGYVAMLTFGIER